MPEHTAGPDILLYDGVLLILISLKTTQNARKLDADSLQEETN